MEQQVVIPREIRNILAQNLLNKDIVDEVVEDVYVLNGFLPGVEVQVEGIKGTVKVERVQPEKTTDGEMLYFAPWTGFTYKVGNREEWTAFSKVLFFNTKGPIIE